MLGGTGPARLRLDDSVTRQQVRPGTLKRIIPYARPYRWRLGLLMLVTASDAVITATIPLILKSIIDDGVMPRRLAVVVALSVTIGVLALLDALILHVQIRCSAQISQSLIYDLRTQVFRHVQRQPLAFFTRAQTGSLVSRLNTDVVGAQTAVTSLLSTAVSAFLTLLLVFAAMFYLSWQMTVVTLLVIPLFLLPSKVVGKRLQRLTREQMQLDADIASMMNERFNVAGALLVKLYGRPEEESRLFESRAGRVRDISTVTAVYARSLFLLMGLLTSLITALMYGFGGSLVIDGTFQLGSLVALITLLTRLFGPINQLSSMQVNVLTALVSFDRVFEVLDLKPLITERPDARPVMTAEDTGAPEIEFDKVSFRYPSGDGVSLASLESIAAVVPERTDCANVLDEVSFRAPAGRLTALVGRSGSGKTTITRLVPRLYDPDSGTVRIGGHDIREVTLESLRETIGVVSQEAHLFHDTIRANLAYARPDADEREIVEACRAAQVWDVISALPDGLDTVVGERGYRLSGGEKQRIAMARLLLKSPPVVVLDEATAHLDSESEAAVQRALTTALEGRTSLVIAHRLSTVRDAGQILVIDEGRIAERGTHEELLAAGGLYAEVYRTQFAPQKAATEP
ncbi:MULTISPECIES: ABC transporter ATP-binding protein [unclassified Streptomyces]|uniref:ABC transporter ATP-binding protein n=1 Tax=unclassified Streptomyces TaxID=2593676 RepID=UPI000F6D845B|nr:MULTISPECIES: ABC transporter ATP-binding protein [unclassified Streptomyces]AZM63741.1 ABC transporter [Streptomyces sp. WAC 01438]RSM94674.1 ABC transporter [Streptomyces sp. WAC 01420]